MTNEPFVSVVMCTFNGSKFIDEQVASILKQDYKNFELIVVDDLSTDNTFEKLVRWKQKDSRVAIHQNEFNLGYNKNFEHALKLANGKLIAVSDQDDIWLPTKISTQVQGLKDGDAMLSHTKSVRLENGRLRYKSASLFNHFKGNDTRKLFMFNQINGHDMMFKKEVLEQCLPIPDDMMYDWWIAVHATILGRVVSVDEYLVHHRIHAENNFFNDRAKRKRQLDIDEVLKLFKTIKAMPDYAKLFLNELEELIQNHQKNFVGKFDDKLFRFLYKNGKIVFGHKKRMIATWHYYKNARKYARFNFRDKGITF